VRGDDAAIGYGTAPELVADAAGTTRYVSYVTFDLSTLPAGSRPALALLYLRASTDLTRPVGVYDAPATWSERTLTWGTQPSWTPRLLGTIGPAKAGDWVSVDIGAALRSGTVSFALTGTEAGAAPARFGSNDGTSPPTLYLGLSGVPATI